MKSEAIVNVTSADGIHAIVDELHDWWFDADAIEFDRERNTIRIPFRREPWRSGSEPADAALIVRGAISLGLDDTEKIRFYDLNTISYDERTRSLVLTGAIPIVVTIGVERIDLSAVRDSSDAESGL